MKVFSRVVMAAAVALAVSVATASAATATPGLPSIPRNVKATNGDENVSLSWSPPSTGAGIDGYLVNTSPADFPRTFTQTTNLSATGLTNGRTYTFSLRAHNAKGYGPATFISATPNPIPPGPPTNLVATQIGPGQVRIDWTPPTSNGSMPDGSTPNITAYNITVNPGGVSKRVDSSTTTYTASGLADNVTYTFTVSATNSRPTTGKPAIVYAPLPSDATIGLQPTAGLITSAITVTGSNFLKNESLTLYWDLTSHVAATLVTDDNGGFTKVVKPHAGDKPGVHKLCANVQPKPCANFTLQATPKPTPASPTPAESPSPSSSPSGNPASGVRPSGGGGISGLDIITRPPFVFLPIIGILGLLGVLIYWALSSRRRPMAPGSASVVHHATRPDYMEPFPSAPRPPAAASFSAPVPPPAPAPASAPPGVPPVQPDPGAAWPLAATPPPVAPPSTAPPPAEQRPSAWPLERPPAPVEAPPPPVWPAAPDEPPDLPQPSD